MQHLSLIANSAGWGIACTAIYSIVRAIRHRHFDAGRTALLFLASASLPSYFKLLYASYSGSIADLPPDWAISSGLAAVVAIGLVGQQVIRDLWSAITSGPATQPKVESSPGADTTPTISAPPAA